MMNNFRIKVLLSIISLISGFSVSSAGQTVFNDETDRIVLAKLIFSNGNKMSFGQLLESNEMYVEEQVEIGEGEMFILDQLQGNLLEQYLTVTPAGTPVPIQLIEFEQGDELNEVLEDDDHINDGAVILKSSFNEDFLNKQGVSDKTIAALAGRRVVNAVVDEVFVDWTDKSEKAVTDLKQAGQGSCNNSTGYQYFQTHHCHISGSHGSGSSQSHCDYHMHSNNQRTSSSKMRSTYSRVANCGGGDVALVHSKKTLGFWYTQDTLFIPVNQARAWQTWSSKNSIRKKRRANVLPVTPGGYIRVWTKFTKNSK